MSDTLLDVEFCSGWASDPTLPLRVVTNGSLVRLFGNVVCDGCLLGGPVLRLPVGARPERDLPWMRLPEVGVSGKAGVFSWRALANGELYVRTDT